MVFSGSDWCAPCIKLDKAVWQSEEFKKEAETNWVIYKADFPKKKANQLKVFLILGMFQMIKKIKFRAPLLFLELDIV